MQINDGLQRFIFEHAEIRGEIARLEETYQTIVSQRDYPAVVKQLLGEALVSCLLLVGSIKFEGELSLQFQGNSALPLMIVQCDHLLNIRGFAKFQEGMSAEDYQTAFVNGQMTLTIHQSHQTEIIQSIVPISSTSMGQNLMNFFAMSEQIATQVTIYIDEQRVVGMLLQLLPGQDTAQREEFWSYATVVGQSVTPEELLYLPNVEILHRLYHETEIRLLLEKNVHFKCRCNSEKMQSVLKMLGPDDINDLLKEYERIEVVCDFCNQKYYFDSIDVAMLFR